MKGLMALCSIGIKQIHEDMIDTARSTQPPICCQIKIKPEAKLNKEGDKNTPNRYRWYTMRQSSMVAYINGIAFKPRKPSRSGACDPTTVPIRTAA